MWKDKKYKFSCKITVSQTKSCHLHPVLMAETESDAISSTLFNNNSPEVLRCKFNTNCACETLSFCQLSGVSLNTVLMSPHNFCRQTSKVNQHL